MLNLVRFAAKAKYFQLLGVGLFFGALLPVVPGNLLDCRSIFRGYSTCNAILQANKHKFEGKEPTFFISTEVASNIIRGLLSDRVILSLHDYNCTFLLRVSKILYPALQLYCSRDLNFQALSYCKSAITRLLHLIEFTLCVNETSEQTILCQQYKNGLAGSARMLYLAAKAEADFVCLKRQRLFDLTLYSSLVSLNVDTCLFGAWLFEKIVFSRVDAYETLRQTKLLMEEILTLESKSMDIDCELDEAAKACFVQTVGQLRANFQAIKATSPAVIADDLAQMATQPEPTILPYELEANCMVCYDFPTPEDPLVRLPCVHVYYLFCFGQWIRTSRNFSCPYCRAQLAPEIAYNLLLHFLHLQFQRNNMLAQEVANRSRVEYQAQHEFNCFQAMRQRALGLPVVGHRRRRPFVHRIGRAIAKLCCCCCR